MKRLRSYFSFQGRANRARYWLTILSIAGLFIVMGLVTAILVQVPVLGILGGIALLVGIPAALVVSLANSARRLHDRGKSVWWLLLFYILPMLLSFPAQLATYGSPGGFQAAAAGLALLGLPFSLWGLVEMGFLKGAIGPNKYGDDPLQLPTEEAFA